MRLYNNDEYREEFMELVYGLLYDDGTNDRANQIIYAFDSAPEVESEPLLPNNPLTLEELREMDGEPVWIEWGGHPQAGWALVRVWSKASNVVYLTYHNGNTDLLGFVLNDGGKIYRRKPEEVEICQKTSSRSG